MNNSWCCRWWGCKTDRTILMVGRRALNTSPIIAESDHSWVIAESLHPISFTIDDSEKAEVTEVDEEGYHNSDCTS